MMLLDNRQFQRFNLELVELSAKVAAASCLFFFCPETGELQRLLKYGGPKLDICSKL